MVHAHICHGELVIRSKNLKSVITCVTLVWSVFILRSSIDLRRFMELELRLVSVTMHLGTMQVTMHAPVCLK